MTTIITERGGGKTTELIKLSSETGAYIVCYNLHEAHEIEMMAHKMDLTIHLPITYDEFLKAKYYSAGIKGFLIDNVDRLLQFISKGVPIVACSISNESTLPEKLIK